MVKFFILYKLNQQFITQESELVRCQCCYQFSKLARNYIYIRSPLAAFGMKSQLVFLFSVKRHIKFQQSARSVVDVVEPRELKLVTSRSSDKGDVVGYLSKFSSTDYIYMSNILYLTHVSILRLGSYCFWVWSPHAMQQVWPELCIYTCIYILTN